MGSTGPKPTIVIVPGSFSPVPFYAKIIAQLTKDGYHASTIPIPSIGRREPLPPATMADDANYVQSIVAPLVQEGKDILMVTHSYGGIVGTESLKGLTTTERRKVGKTGGVSGVLYITSIVPKMGTSLKDMMGDLVPSYLHVEEDYMTHDPVPSGAITFSDLPADEGVKLAAAMPAHSTVSFDGKATHPGYKDVDVSFMFCEEDKILPPEFQEQMIELLESETGRKVDVFRVACAHCPNASCPEKVVEVIEKVAGKDL